jgi:hypothetical protein
MRPNIASEHATMNDEILLLKQLEELQETHRKLDSEITELGRNSWENEFILARLKKQKLQLRDEIAQIEIELYPDMPA